MVSGVKQDQMERQLLELVSLSKYQQQLKMEGQLKELPHEESQERAEDVWERHDEAVEPSVEQLSKYPLCHSEEISSEHCGRLVEDEWSREQHLLEEKQPVSEQLLERRQTEHMLEERQPEHLLERWQPEHMLEERQPEHLLERWQPEHMLEERQPEHLLERWQPEHLLERWQPKHLLEERQPEHLLERWQPEHLLERWQPEHLLERRQPEHMLEEGQPEQLLERRQPEHLLEESQPEYLLEEKQPKLSLKETQLHVQQRLERLVWERQLKRVQQKQHLGHVQELRGNHLQKHPGEHQLKSLGRDNRILDPSEHNCKLELAITENEQQQEEIIKTPQQLQSPVQELGCLDSVWWMTKLQCLQGLLDTLTILTMILILRGGGTNLEIAYRGCSSKECLLVEDLQPARTNWCDPRTSSQRPEI